jgi:hypothetical protein
MHKLRVLGGLNAGAEIALEPQPCIVGSDERCCDIVLAHGSIPGRAFALLCTEPRRIKLEVFEAEVLKANDSILAAGSHELELPLHLHLGDSDLLIGIDAEAFPPAAPEPTTEDAARPAPAPKVKGKLYAVIACACALLVALAVWQALPGSQAIEQELPGRKLPMHPGQPDVTAQLDAAAGVQASRVRTLGAGVVVVEPSAGPSSTRQAARRSAGTSLALRTWRTGDGGYLETAHGLRYAVGSEMPGGYTLVRVDEDSITIRRGGRDVQLAVRSHDDTSTGGLQ